MENYSQIIQAESVMPAPAGGLDIEMAGGTVMERDSFWD